MIKKPPQCGGKKKTLCYRDPYTVDTAVKLCREVDWIILTLIILSYLILWNVYSLKIIKVRQQYYNNYAKKFCDAP